MPCSISRVRSSGSTFPPESTTATSSVPPILPGEHRCERCSAGRLDHPLAALEQKQHGAAYLLLVDRDDLRHVVLGELEGELGHAT